MAIDGDWDIVVKTPMGDQRQTVTFATNGGVLTGKHVNPLATVEIADGRVDGDKLSWRVDVTTPMPMRLQCEALVSGDQISGSVKTPLGAMPLSGTRIG